MNRHDERKSTMRKSQDSALNISRHFKNIENDSMDEEDDPTKRLTELSLIESKDSPRIDKFSNVDENENLIQIRKETTAMSFDFD